MRHLILAAALAGLAYVSLGIWSQNETVNAILSIVFFLILMGKMWNGAIYFYIGSLSYGYLNTVMGFTVFYAATSAVLWPVTAGMGVLSIAIDITNVTEIMRGHSIVEAETEDTIEVIDSPAENNDTLPNAITREPTLSTHETIDEQLDQGAENVERIWIKSDSNVRDGPGTDFALVGVAKEGEAFVVLDKNSEETWYKIELSTRQVGWIGSSRVTKEPP